MKRKLIVCALLTLLGVGGGLLHIKPAFADIILNPNPAMPASLENYLINCDSGGQSPAFVQWLSLAGNPTVTTLNVPYGAPSVNLDLRFGGAVCFRPSSTLQTQLRVMDVRPSVPGTTNLEGRVLGLDFTPGQNTPGTFRGAAVQFNYAPTGGFRTSGLYTLVLDNRVINRFPDRYECVTPPSPVVNGWNYAGCPPSGTSLRIQINVGAQPSMTCNGITINPSSDPEPGQPFTVTGGFTVSGPAGPPTGAGMSMVIPSLGVNQPLFLGGVSRNSSTNRTSSPLTAPAGVYTGYFDVSVPIANPATRRCNFTVVVGSKPYFRLYGGDGQVGAGARTGASCNTAPGARFIGYNRDTNPFLGAGSHLAIFVPGTNIDFATGQGLARYGYTQPKPLTFANSGAGPPGTAYGGGLAAGSIICAEDFYGQVSGTPISAAAATAFNPASSGTFQRTGSLTLTGGVLPHNTQRTIYVDGNVNITGPITFAGGAYANPRTIPVLRLIVRGNIYVHPSVGQLDGIYVAHSDGTPDSGRFYTCGGQPYAGNTPARVPTRAQIVADCDQRLVVYGAVVAESVKLLRSNGTLSNSTLLEYYSGIGGNAAEIFVFSPEVWMNGRQTISGELDAIRALPPVL